MSWTHHRAVLARARQTGDTQKADQAAAELKVDRLEDHIRRTVDSLPPLTADQRARLAELLRPSAEAVAA